MDLQLRKLTEAKNMLQEVAVMELERAEHATPGNAPIHLWHHARLTQAADQIGEVITYLDEMSN